MKANPAYIPTPTEQRHQVVRPHGGQAHHPHIDQGLRRATLDDDPPGGHHDRPDQQADHPDRAPAPYRRLADAEEQGHQPGRQQDHRRPAQPARGPDPRLGDHQVGGDCSQGQDDRRDPEQPVVVEGVDDRTGQHDAEAGPDGSQRRDDPYGAWHLLGRKLVPDDAERQRQDAAADALDDPPDEHDRQRIGHGRQQRAHRQGGEAATSMRSLPHMSPRRPMIGVKIDADSR